MRDNSLGGGSGASLTTLSGFDPTFRQALTYWVSLGCAVVAMLGIYLLLRSRLGLALTAVRDDETAARGVGVRVGVAKRIVYLVAAAGCAAAGGLLLVSTLNVTPDSDFSVQWSAYMIFIAVIGGIGTMEGPLLGAILFIVLQQTLSNYGAWYLVLLGGLAIVVAVWTRRGLWPLLTDRIGLTLFPTGYVVDDEHD
jgi:branched-chain amino acid transport system permease protein